jgi:hypothetical protein
MPRKKINTDALLKMVDAGKSQAECARHFGVSNAAISKKMREVRGKKTLVTAAKKVEAVVDQGLDTWAQLAKINTHANWILDHVMRWIQGDEEAIQVLETAARKVNRGTREEPEWVTDYKFTDPHVIALRAMGEIKSQVELQLKIFESLYSVREVEAFQREVLDILAEVEPEVRNEILKRLNQRRAFRAALSFR